MQTFVDVVPYLAGCLSSQTCLEAYLKDLCLQEHHTPVRCGMLGGLLVGVIGVLVPPVMFWGEYEIQTLANPSKGPLPHIWPSGGAYGLQPFQHGNYNTGYPHLAFLYRNVLI